MRSLLRPFDPRRSLLLAVESATSRVSVVIARGGSVLAHCSEAGARHHAETLLPQIDAALEQAQLQLAEVDAFAVSIGPGTFTSLRIGLSTIKGLAFASDRPVAAISTLRAVAHSAGSTLGSSPRVAVLDARRGEFYAGAFDVDGSFAARRDLLPEAVYDCEELAAKLPLPCELVGEGVIALAELLRERGSALQPDACRELQPDARSVAALGSLVLGKGEGIDAARLIPRYLRRAQAEEDRIRAGSA